MPAPLAVAPRKVEIKIAAGASFVSADQVEAAAREELLRPAAVKGVVGHYEDAQLDALKLAFLAAAILAGLSLIGTSQLPDRRLE